jgi:flagellar export protein FliJ
MPFSFRLQKVLEYRRTQEGEAKQVFLDKRAATIEAEARISAIQAHRQQVLHEPVADLAGFLGLEARLAKSDDEERHEVAALGVLRDEEAAAEEIWHERRRDLEAISRLRERALQEWQLDEDRKEQAALDEWANHRRAA